MRSYMHGMARHLVRVSTKPVANARHGRLPSDDDFSVYWNLFSRRVRTKGGGWHGATTSSVGSTQEITSVRLLELTVFRPLNLPYDKLLLSISVRSVDHALAYLICGAMYGMFRIAMK
jgi:hypothetical protein